MRRDQYLDNPDSGSGVFRTVLAIAMSIVLVASVAFGLYVKLHRETVLDAVRQFELAMEEARYPDALEVLRDVQARVADQDAGGGGGPDAVLFRETLQQMEQTVGERVQSIFSRLERKQEALSSDDRAFLEGMGELTGMLVSGRLRDLCAGLLTGTETREAVDAAFLSLGSLSNVSQPTRALKTELDGIENYSEAVRTAESTLEEALYFDSLEQFEQIASETAGFVQSYALSRAQACKEEMLEPLSARASSMIRAGRYYSARDLLERLQNVFPENKDISKLFETAVQNTAETLEVFYGPVEHISVRPLIVNPARAFDGDIYTDSIAQGMMTTSEFRALLAGLYERGYVLIDIDTLLDAEGQPAPVLVPPGKKPLLFTLETANYYAHRAANGLCSNLVLDSEGNVSGQYLDGDGTLRVEREAEAIGILEVFVEEHPDFSFDGAKGILSLTGYESVFGYVCNSEQLTRRNENNAESGLAQQQIGEVQMAENRTAVQEIAEQLLSRGWRFASSTYAFLQAGSDETTREELEEDAIRWEEQVGSLVGQTDIMMYPNGSFLNGDDPRCIMLRERGFRYFAGLGPQAYVFYRDNYVYMDKTAINGYAMDNTDLSRFFDARAARDPMRPQ